MCSPASDVADLDLHGDPTIGLVSEARIAHPDRRFPPIEDTLVAGAVFDRGLGRVWDRRIDRGEVDER